MNTTRTLPVDRLTVDALNRGCACHNVDRARLMHALATEQGVAESWLAERPNLFSGRALYVAQAHLDAMAGLAAAMRRVVCLPGWQARASGLTRPAPSATTGTGETQPKAPAIEALDALSEMGFDPTHFQFGAAAR